MMRISLPMMAAFGLAMSGCDTLPTTGQTSQKPKPSDIVGNVSKVVVDTPEPKVARPIRASDIGPNTTTETIKALQDELDAAAR